MKYSTPCKDCNGTGVIGTRTETPTPWGVMAYGYKLTACPCGRTPVLPVTR